MSGMTNRVLFCFCAMIMLAGCDITMPSQVETGQIRVTEQQTTEALPAAYVDTGAVTRIANDYKRNGQGPISVLVSYVDDTPAGQAHHQAGQYKRAFAAQGVTVRTDIAAVPKTTPLRAIVSYQAMAALPPEGCNRMAGYQGAEGLYEMKDYGIGCETKTAISRMIATPDDLLGKESGAGTESRRAGNTTEKYKNGTPNTKIEGIRSSDVGG